MKVLLSIKPEFASRIFDGSKKYEYRRSIFKRRGVKSIVVYASDPIKLVIGEFEIGDILHDRPDELWAQTWNYAGITKKGFMDYFANLTKGYAIAIREVRPYERPLSLNELMISQPPQSFRYLNTHPQGHFDSTTEKSSSLNLLVATLG